MSKQSNPTLIGAFVVGGIVVLAIAVAVFGGSELFARKTVLVTYFDGSVKGLREGANVLFRGVRVGFVRQIGLLTDVETLSPKIEVTMELLPESIQVLRAGQPIEGGLESAVTIERLVDAGFSAQLGSESFVTGLLLVELDFHREQELTLYGGATPYPEIPSVPSEIQQAIARFQNFISDIEQNVDFAQLSKRVFSILQGMDELVHSPDLLAAMSGLNEFVNAEDTQQLSASMQQALQDLRTTTREAARVIEGVDANVDTLVSELKPATGRLNAALAEAEEVLQAVRLQLTGDSTQMFQLQSTLTEIESAAQSMRMFFEYVERNPEALLRGK